MIKGRQFHACAIRGNDVFVIGGEMSTRSSFEIWNGKHWSYSASTIGATELQLISQGNNLYLFGGWGRGIDVESPILGNVPHAVNKFWKVTHNNVFIEEENTVMARKSYSLFTVPRSYLTNCQGKHIYLKYFHYCDVFRFV